MLPTNYDQDFFQEDIKEMKKCFDVLKVPGKDYVSIHKI